MNYTNKTWNSLSDLKARIESSNQETVISFNGHTLITDQHKYSLAFGKLTAQKRDGQLPQSDK